MLTINKMTITVTKFLRSSKFTVPRLKRYKIGRFDKCFIGFTILKKPRAEVVTPQGWYLVVVFGGSDNGATEQKYNHFVAERGV